MMAASADTFDASRYLTESLPVLLFKALGASDGGWVLQVLVPGQVALRTHYVVGKDGVEVRSGFAASPQVTLSLQLPELEQLARGGLKLEEALLLRRIQVFGDARRAEQISRSLRS